MDLRKCRNGYCCLTSPYINKRVLFRYETCYICIIAHARQERKRKFMNYTKNQKHPMLFCAKQTTWGAGNMRIQVEPRTISSESSTISFSAGGLPWMMETRESTSV